MLKRQQQTQTMQHNIKHTQGTHSLHQFIKFKLHRIHLQQQALDS